MSESMDASFSDGGVNGGAAGGSTRLRDAADLIEVMGVAFSDEQIEAITADPAPGVIIAGAGTGKTTVMAARVVWLVGRGVVTPERVLGLTFTRKATGELAARTQAALAKLAPDDERHCAVQTYDGFASRLMGEFGAWIGSDASERVLSSVEPYILADKVLRDPGSLPGHLADKGWSTLTRAIVNLESRVQSHLIADETIVADAGRFIERLDQAPLWRGNPYRSLVDARQVVEERLDLLGLCQRYRQAKRRESVVEFADQMAGAVGLATRLPGVGRALRERYGLVVVDEFQDTSVAQVTLLSLLFGAQGGIAEYPITAVGDPLQAIYTWRGAAADNIYSFHRWFPSASQRTYTLSINRRSGAHILDAANAVATQVRADPQLGAGLAVELRPADQAPESTVVVREFLTVDEEVEWLADDLVEAHRRGEHERWDQVAILVRRNRDVGPVLQACRARLVPIAVQEVGGLLSVEA
ncbi:MAG: ATP-dependent helicase, partial [Propionibacteriaceae bacterium]|nr:ATP-dependent helicase [Propionibacteriaceae bacterium]